MDVEMQMEANGLPSQFSTTSDQPQDAHVVDNLAASISNSEATANPIPTKPATSEPTPQMEPETAPSAPESAPQPELISDTITVAQTEPISDTITVARTEPVSDTTTVARTEPVSDTTTVARTELISATGTVAAPEAAPVMNGTTEHASEAAEKPLSTVPDSQPPTSLETIIAPPAPTLSESTLTESFVPSSIPAEIQSSATPVEATDSVMSFSEPVPEPASAPLSDLRTSPHSDALAPEAVAQVEAEKHELDNAADLAATPQPSITIASLPTVAAPSNSENSVSQAAITSLPSPPAQSPPPAPHPAPATLSEPVVEPPTKSVTEALEPTPQPVQEMQEPAPVPATRPVEEPRAPAPTPAIPAPVEPQDEEMVDVASHPPKQTREREDDTEDLERAAKRFKTDEPLKGSEEPDFKMPEIPAASVSGASSPQVANGESAAFNGLTDGDDTVTPARLAHMKKVISNLKKSNASAAFRLPVDYMALKIPSYPEIVKEPMDLQTIDQRLKQNQYRSVATFVRDFELIVHNCITFNGPDHGVSQAARKMQYSFRVQLRNLPKANDEEPSKETKKAARKHEPTRQAPPRRPSVTAPNNTITVQPASSPKTVAPATPSFAPGPDGMPLIRRDSTLADGRPKRAIVPTKRNQEFGGGRPKKKKYELQLKFCDEVLKEIASPKHWQLNQYFTHPVDPVALNIPTYFQIIKKPMDLATVRTKLTNNVYEKARDFEEDVRLIFKNCYKFNPDGDLVHTSGRQLEDLFNEKWATKDEWIAAREPPSEPQSDADEDDEEEDEESEDEADDSEEDRNDKIKMLQKQIEEMSKQMGELTQKKSKKSKSKSPPTKKKAKAAKKEKPAAGTPNLGKEKKERKKAAPRARPEKDRYVTFAEKQYISNGIAMLPEKQMQEALKIIQNSVPSLANSDQNEIELDIEEVPNHALLKLLNFVKRYAGPPPDEPKAEPADVYAPAATKSKKSKPMSKHEQEAQIEELKGRLGAYGGPGSPNAVPSIEAGDSSDDDDGDSEEREEE